MKLPEWSSSITKNLVRLEDGQFAIGVFRGELIKFYQHWKANRSVICTGRETCPLCQSPDENDHKASGKFRVNFLVQDAQGQWLAQIFEGGKRVFERIKVLNDNFPLEKIKVKITRTGKGKDTQYHLDHVMGEAGKVTAEMEKKIMTVPLLALKEEEASEPDEAA